MSRTSWTTLATPIGDLILAASADGLTHVAHPGHSHADERGDGSAAASRIVETAADQLREYFAGTRTSFDVPLAPTGTVFRRSVWDALMGIPFGETTTYGELAARLGRPTASRAVGAANGANPISVIVPCHRVIGADGSLTGYAGGIGAKRLLLDLERS